MTLREARSLVVLLAAVALVAGVAGAPTGAVTATDGADQTTVDSCTTIDEPGTYVLTSDIDNGGKTPISGACFRITADDVTFDGNGHTIDGRGVSHTKGVAVVDAKNVTVTNFEVDDWHSGVLVDNGSATVRAVHTFSNAYGVRLENASGSTVTNNTVEGNLIGIYTNSEDVTLDGNDLSENEISIKRAGDSES